MAATSSKTIRKYSSKIRLCSKPNYISQYIKQYFLGPHEQFYTLTNLVTIRWRIITKAIIVSHSSSHSELVERKFHNITTIGPK